MQLAKRRQITYELINHYKNTSQYTQWVDNDCHAGGTRFEFLKDSTNLVKDFRVLLSFVR